MPGTQISACLPCSWAYKYNSKRFDKVTKRQLRKYLLFVFSRLKTAIKTKGCWEIMEQKTHLSLLP